MRSSHESSYHPAYTVCRVPIVIIQFSNVRAKPFARIQKPAGTDTQQTLKSIVCLCVCSVHSILFVVT